MQFSGEVTVAPVQNDATLWEFLRLPWRIHQEDPHWVPPILSQQRRFLDPRHGPFFEIGEARYFLASRNGRPIHKVRAMVVGISQPYQRRRLHLALILHSYIYLVKHTPCQMADFSLIPENLKPWIKVIQAIGGQRYGVFRVFEKPI